MEVNWLTSIHKAVLEPHPPIIWYTLHYTHSLLCSVERVNPWMHAPMHVNLRLRPCTTHTCISLQRWKPTSTPPPPQTQQPKGVVGTIALNGRQTGAVTDTAHTDQYSTPLFSLFYLYLWWLKPYTYPPAITHTVVLFNMPYSISRWGSAHLSEFPSPACASHAVTDGTTAIPLYRSPLIHELTREPPNATLEITGAQVKVQSHWLNTFVNSFGKSKQPSSEPTEDPYRGTGRDTIIT